MENETSIRVNEVDGLTPRALSDGLSVGELERALLAAMPAHDACTWDRTGMLVGDPSSEVRGVAIALDPTIAALEQAYRFGCNVLVTHHPVFLDAPESFLPALNQGHTPGAVVRHAIQHDISIISFHTALDVSVAGLGVLPALLRLEQVGVLEPLAHDASKGFGAVCAVPSDQDTLTLNLLAARCTSVFGSIPRVWGNPETPLHRVVTSGGSAGSFAQACIQSGVQCLVCGEMKYHEALDASQSGLAIIELGHDVSEAPLCAVLASYVVAAGVPESRITMTDGNTHWFTPEAIRK